MIRTFPKDQHDLLKLLAGRPANVETTIDEACRALQRDQVFVSAAAQVLQEEGLLAIQKESYEEIRLGELGLHYADRPLPERQVLTALKRDGGAIALRDLAVRSGLEKRAAGESLRHLAKKGWATKESGTLTLSPAGTKALWQKGPDEQLLQRLKATGALRRDVLVAEGLGEGLMLLEGRKGMLVQKNRTVRRLKLTDSGRAAVAEGISTRVEVTQLTSEHLLKGTWRDVDFKRYDPTLQVAPKMPGKPHPMRRVLNETRRVFLQMGFEETSSPHVESGFWDFDALFQPQDHPAREMQDTFYLQRPARCELPDGDLVSRVRQVHENGGSTGSLGWQYRWSEQKAEAAVLRTHTTAATIRALAEDPKPPRKVFCVGKVFRREAIDYKHLPVFYQVDGIIIDRGGTFADLLGTLSIFYRKMGFDRFEFRPAFFPYTEPSVEVFVYLPEKKDWVEMGGAGIFRPEVTEPAGCEVPVLAWGLGLERVALFRYDLTDIRELYLSDLNWLKELPLCR